MPQGRPSTSALHGVWATLRRYADAGAAVLVITHDVPMLTSAKIADATGPAFYRATACVFYPDIVHLRAMASGGRR
ncbi:hypothetical protein [Actinomadura miaoliensis]|uniref:Uncharacterized protein n=1 Tax=Actinomadura miaoliensis TaxID=430685 RepID=A0ABP7V882_9ACTN